MSNLVAYFSHPDPFNPEGDGESEPPSGYVQRDGSVLGTVQVMAEVIAKVTHASTYRIQSKRIYPSNFKILEQISKAEKQRGDRPELREPIPDLKDVENVFLGYPMWWMDAPMAVYSFLEKADLKGKELYLFAAQSDYGLADTLKTITDTAKGAKVNQTPLSASCYLTIEQLQQEVIAWLYKVNG
ncbi:MAG: hypothetical protein II014_02745 [Bifidobacteriaceae bacterium]|nr:hypothetical protein [Bifidobacteriaceae bacterium]